MSEKVKNATEFLQIFRDISSKYENLIRPKFVEVAHSQDPTFDADLGGPDQLLEAHSRMFVVDALLRSLNWIDDFVPGDSSLMMKAPAKSLKTGHRRHLDYLGFESNSNRALMIVETKRPSAQLPDVLEKDGDSGIGVPRETFTAIAISKGLRGAELTHGWKDWLADLKDYFLSIGQANNFP